MAKDMHEAEQAASQQRATEVAMQRMAQLPSQANLDEATQQQAMSARPILQAAEEALPVRPSTLQVGSCLYNLRNLALATRVGITLSATALRVLTLWAALGEPQPYVLEQLLQA